MRDAGMRHFFPPGTFTRFTRFLHDLRDFYTILRNFYAILRDFYMILRDFGDFYAIICQAKNLVSQAPKTIMQACPWVPP